MVEQHSKDYKLTAVKYYLTHNKTMRDVCNKTYKYPYKRYNLLFAITANKIVDYVLYKDIKGGLKTTNIIDFYNNSIKDKYKNLSLIHI